jgi:hypothetical protein
VHVDITAASLLRPSHTAIERGRLQGLNGSRAWSFPTCLGSLTPRCQRIARATNAALHVAFPVSRHGRHTEVVISELNTWPVCTPVNASPAPLRTQVHDSEPKWCATPFLCGSLIRYSMPVYLGASLITRSALASTFGGIVRPICLAALRLITSSNLVGCSTGRSAGLAPRKILWTKVAA